MKISFIIEWVPPALNKSLRTHWAERHRQRKVAAGYILAAIGHAGVYPVVPVRVTIQMYRRNVLDQDGAYGACKPIFDALVYLGYARDDSPRWMQQKVLPVLIDRRRPRTEIRLE